MSPEFRKKLRALLFYTPEHKSCDSKLLGSLAKNHALEMLKEAHDFKLRLADLDPEAFSFEKVFANDLQRTPYAQNIEESNNETEDFEDFSSQADPNARYSKAHTVWNE